MLCPKCNTNEANHHPVYGVVHCDDCNNKNVTLNKRVRYYAQSKKDRIQAQQDKYHQDMEPPYIGDKPNPNYVKLYPEDAKEMFSEDELKRL